MKPNPILRKLNQALEKHELRICQSCGQCHPMNTDYFYQNMRGGLKYVCIPCRCAEVRAYCKRQRANDLAWRARRLAECAAYYRANPKSAVPHNRRRAAFERILSGVRIERGDS